MLRAMLKDNVEASFSLLGYNNDLPFTNTGRKPRSQTPKIKGGRRMFSLSPPLFASVVLSQNIT